MQVNVDEHAGVNPGTVIMVGPLNLELLGVTKSTWNLKRCNVVVLNRSTKKLGSPAGGRVAPSRSDGRKENSCVLVKHTADAEVPANMAERLYAQDFAPAKAVGVNIL